MCAARIALAAPSHTHPILGRVPLTDALSHHPLLLLFSCLAVGSAAGAVRLRGFSLGPAAVLFTALALSAWDERLELPGELGALGLALFAYCVGIASGPSFFAALRHHLGAALGVVAGLTGCGVVAVGLGRILGIEPGVIAGAYAGALTNTPALAAATDQAAGASGPTVGYSVTYVGGVLMLLVAAAWVLRRPAPPPVGDGAPLVSRTVRVTADDLPDLGRLARDEGVVFSRVKHADGLEVARDDMRVAPGDLVTAVGTKDRVSRTQERIGTRTDADDELTLDRHELDMRRVALSNRSLSGRTVDDIGLDRFEARATRIRRGDVDLIATPATRLHLGDRVRVIAPRARIPEVSRFLGDSERGPGDLNPIGLSIGMAAGVALGLVPIPIPGGHFSLGVAAGPLLVGLVLGRMARSGPVAWSLPYTASQLLQHLGILVFLAQAGSRAGSDLAAAISGGQAPRIAVLGVAISAFACATLVVVARRFRLGGPHLAGVVAGAQTQPAILAFAQERTGNDQRVAHGYALIFPAAMVTKILVAIAIAALA